MKKPLTILLSILLIGLNMQAQAQMKNDFPPPQNFTMEYVFILHLQYFICGGSADGLPYCFNFNWQTPQNDNRVVGYNIYNYNTHDPDETKIVFEDAVIIAQSTPSFKYIEIGGDYEGFFWVTAVYEEPDGESAPSNLQSKFYTYDFMALNDDGIPIYYKFRSNEEMSVEVTHKYSEEEIELCIESISIFGLEGIECGSYSGNVEIPETVVFENQQYSVLKIGNRAFYASNTLTNVTIPESIINIGGYAFSDCYNLNDVTIPSSVKSIGRNAFEKCISFNEIIIPGSVTSIEQDAFSGCTNVENIVIGENVENIGAFAFAGCQNIKSIIIPKNVNLIGLASFTSCYKMEEIIVSEENDYYTSLDGVLFNKDKSLIIAYPNAKSSVYTIPNSVTKIEHSAFRECINLREITIPNSVKTIENFSFYRSLISNIFIPESVTSVGFFSFGECEELEKVVIPDSNIFFDDRIFWRCWNLSEIYNLSPIPQTIGSYSFNGVSCKLFVPFGSYNAYREHIVWGQFNNIIEVETSINEVILENVTINTYYGGISVISNDLVNIEIFNLTGQKIYQSTFLGSKEIPLDKGVYIIGINGKNSKIIIK